MMNSYEDVEDGKTRRLCVACVGEKYLKKKIEASSAAPKSSPPSSGEIRSGRLNA